MRKSKLLIIPISLSILASTALAQGTTHNEISNDSTPPLRHTLDNPESMKEALDYHKKILTDSKQNPLEIPTGHTGDLILKDNDAIENFALTKEDIRLSQETEKRGQELEKAPEYLKALQTSKLIEANEINGQDTIGTNQAQSMKDSLNSNKVIDSKSNMMPLTSTYKNSLSVPSFKQVTTWFCAPATVQQLDNYYNGTKYSQYLWADNDHLQTTRDGTVFSRVKGVLNQYVKTGYNYYSVGSFNNWHSRVVNSIDYNKPAVLDIDSRGISGFEYSTSGHILNVRGYQFGNVPNQAQVSDPHYAYAGIKWYGSQNLYQANSNHFNNAFIY